MVLTVTESMIESRFRAMGTDVHITTVGGDTSILYAGEQRIRELEARWSRFRETSEITRLNRHAGRPVIVSPDTFDLIARAVTAWSATAGRFDPTVGPALAAYGYDRDFTDIITGTSAAPRTTTPAPGPAGIELIPGINSITLPPGVSLDAGGIGKGFAADLTAALLLEAGADGALVNVGGDLRTTGRAPTPEGWVVNVADPIDPRRELLRLAIPGGAVATSSRLLRRWQTADGEAHHLIDPATGRPADTETVAVTVIAGEAWWAEALTKMLFLTGPAGLDDFEDAHAVVVTDDGARHATATLTATLR